MQPDRTLDLFITVSSLISLLWLFLPHFSSWEVLGLLLHYI